MIQQITGQLAQHLSKDRLEHTIGVSGTARQLADKYGANADKAELAGLLHDRARQMPSNNLLQLAQAFAIVVNDAERNNPALLHGPVGACLVASEFGIDDADILRAIRLHTTGGAGMTLLDKIIYLADYIEPNRSYPGVEKLRRLAAEDLDKALLAAYDQTLSYVIDNGWLIHPATVEGRNELLIALKTKG